MNARRSLASGVVCAGMLMLSACGGGGDAVNAPKRAVLAAFDRTLTSSYVFSDTDTDLTHTTVVTGTVEDSYRHSALVTVDGRPRWQEIVRDDAVADLFTSPDAVTTYSGRGSSQYLDAHGITSSAALAHLSGAPTAPGAPTAAGGSPSASPSTASTGTVLGAALPPESSPEAVLTALKAGQWVLDPVGAPPPVTASQDQIGRLSSPIYNALRSLEAGQVIAHSAGLNDPLREWVNGDLTPTFKPADDPFPPPGAGVTRYDLLEPPIPGLTPGHKTPDPLGIQYVEKVAFYVQNGYISQIRIVDDPTDRLQTIAKLYNLNLPSGLTGQALLAEGELIVNQVQGSQALPYRVHQEVLSLSFQGRGTPVSLPTSYVRGSLALLPLHGQHSSPAPTS